MTEKNRTRPLDPVEIERSAVSTLLLHISNQLAVLTEAILDLADDLRTYRTTREAGEQNTNEKIEKVLRTRLSFLYWLLDKVAPAIFIAILIAIFKKLGLL